MSPVPPRHPPIDVTISARMERLTYALSPTHESDGRLPPELVLQILQFLPLDAIFTVVKTCRLWRNLIETNSLLWMRLLHETGTWFGDQSEVSFLRRVVEHRNRHPTLPSPWGASLLILEHPYKLLLKFRRTVMSRWKTQTPKAFDVPCSRHRRRNLPPSLSKARYLSVGRSHYRYP